MIRTIVSVGALSTVLIATSEAQFATVGAGLLMSNRASQPVAELHAESPSLHDARGYATVSWTDDSWKPAVITAGERSWPVERARVGLGAGLLWLPVPKYRPYPILVSTVVLPLPIPRASIVGIGSTQPFQDFEWSFVLKLGVAVWFVR